MDNEHYSKLMDDLERQDRLLLLVTDKLVSTIEELKIAHAAKETSSRNTDVASSSPPRSGSAQTSNNDDTMTSKPFSTINRPLNTDKSTLSESISAAEDTQTFKVDETRQRKATADVKDEFSREQDTAQNRHGQEHEWTVTLTDGTGKSIAACSVNERHEK